MTKLHPALQTALQPALPRVPGRQEVTEQRGALPLLRLRQLCLELQPPPFRCKVSPPPSTVVKCVCPPLVLHR